MMCSGLQAGDEKAVLSTKKCKRKLTRHNNYQCLGHFYFILFQSRVKASFQWTRQVHMKTQRQTRWISTDIHRRCCFHRLRSYSVGVSCGSCQRVDFSVLISASAIFLSHLWSGWRFCNYRTVLTICNYAHKKLSGKGFDFAREKGNNYRVCYKYNKRCKIAPNNQEYVQGWCIGIGKW